ncbi:MAG: phage baseplate protein, partial [Okeania sp. SIO2D1]|nr:phage baseplate protein [Okeania sp. SIO2D1]
SAIKIVKQPTTSFGGKPEEDDDRFITRVSERLRHKQRAITAWDYERLVLEEFPEIYKVKCIAATDDNNNPADAKVTVVVIPDISNTTPLPEEPKAPLYLLKEIKDLLKKYTSEFVEIEVKNPEYEPVTCTMEVVFSGESSREGEYINKLNEELKQFFAPWAYDQTVDIPLGRSIEESLVINFIAQREYVHYVADFEFKETIEMKPDSILVSAENHEITAVAEPDSYGIGYMVIGDNFIVN